MVNVTCCGDQDRNTEASETHPYRPPNDTRNCYTRGNDSPARFDWNQCGVDDKACLNHGGCSGCIPDSFGGYCQETNGDIYVSHGSEFIKLEGKEIIDRLGHENNYERNNLRLRRRERDYERKMENRIREMQIMGRDPFPSRQINNTQSSTSQPDTTPQSFVGSYMNNIGLGLGILLLLISLGLEYAKRNNLLK